jgi:AhpD family alkylhydroperoxidase
MSVPTGLAILCAHSTAVPDADRFPARELSGGARSPSLSSMFTIHEGSRETLAALERNVGFIPNLAAAIAASPTALQGFVGLQTALRSSSRLTDLEREVVGVTVSRLNDCAYSLAAHSRFAALAGGTPELVAALRSGEPLEDARLRTLQSFTETVWRERGHTDPDCLDHETALEVIAQVAYTTFANYAADVTGAPIDEAFTMP